MKTCTLTLKVKGQELVHKCVRWAKGRGGQYCLHLLALSFTILYAPTASRCNPTSHITLVWTDSINVSHTVSIQLVSMPILRAHACCQFANIGMHLLAVSCQPLDTATSHSKTNVFVAIRLSPITFRK